VALVDAAQQRLVSAAVAVALVDVFRQALVVSVASVPVVVDPEVVHQVLASVASVAVVVGLAGAVLALEVSEVAVALEGVVEALVPVSAVSGVSVEVAVALEVVDENFCSYIEYDYR
jgi:hypothetical protein